MEDQEYMQLALSLAVKGVGKVNPNPLVGAVIVKDGTVIGQGWHEKFGGLHAERNALANCTQSPEGATIYVTLEPCCHWGKTPPCTDALMKSGIRRVVIGSQDPNPLVAGKGIRILRDHGIEVVEHVLAEECDRLNAVFFHYIQTKTPYIVMKYAMTMDGKIAAYTGESRWITGEEARHHVHEDRNRYMGIMIGIGTLLKDDPLLTCRIPDGRNPVRIICDSRLRIPLTSQIVNTAVRIPTIIATCTTDHPKISALQEAGCRLLFLPSKEGRLDLLTLAKRLGEQNIDSILLEGGSTLTWSALEAGIVQKVQTYIAPKILGGETAKTPVSGQGAPTPDLGIQLAKPSLQWFGKDLLIESEVLSCSQVSSKKPEKSCP